jgi:hypothetical protein
MDPAVEWLEEQFDADPGRVFGANARPGPAWVRRLFELKSEAHADQDAPHCVCYISDSDFIFAGSLPPMEEDEIRGWLDSRVCRRPEEFKARHRRFFKRNGFKNNLIEE